MCLLAFLKGGFLILHAKKAKMKFLDINNAGDHLPSREDLKRLADKYMYQDKVKLGLFCISNWQQQKL
jgi:hypothetical protein